MGITASQVNELRQKTGAGMMDCKKALTEANGDIEAAIDILRKKGQKVSELRSGKEANEGLVIAKVSDDGKTGIIVRLNSETDFVAKNQDFVDFAEVAATVALENKPADLDALLAAQADGKALSEHVVELVGKINENIQLNAYELLEADSVVAYNHAGNKIGVLVALNKGGEGVAEIGRDVAMQVAAMNPAAASKDGVPQEVVDRELQIGRDQALAEGKPENIVDKIAEGRLNKFFKENTLLPQQFVKDGSKTVEQVLKDVDSELTVLSFKRVALAD